MVQICNYCHLQSDQNVHVSMEVGVFYRKCTTVIASSAINLITFFGLKMERAIGRLGI